MRARWSSACVPMRWYVGRQGLTACQLALPQYDRWAINGAGVLTVTTDQEIAEGVNEHGAAIPVGRRCRRLCRRQRSCPPARWNDVTAVRVDPRTSLSADRAGVGGVRSCSAPYRPYRHSPESHAMNRHARHPVHAAPSNSQRGATLVVVLILLLLMTLLGLASLRSTVLEERMTSNLLDRSHQLSRSPRPGCAKRKRLVSPMPAPAAFTAGCCVNGLCGASGSHRDSSVGLDQFRIQCSGAQGTVVDPTPIPIRRGFIIEEHGRRRRTGSTAMKVTENIAHPAVRDPARSASPSLSAAERACVRHPANRFRRQITERCRDDLPHPPRSASHRASSARKLAGASVRLHGDPARVCPCTPASRCPIRRCRPTTACRRIIWFILDDSGSMAWRYMYSPTITSLVRDRWQRGTADAPATTAPKTAIRVEQHRAGRDVRPELHHQHRLLQPEPDLSPVAACRWQLHGRRQPYDSVSTSNTPPHRHVEPQRSGADLLRATDDRAR